MAIPQKLVTELLELPDVIRHRYHPEASAEYQAAVAWYRERFQDAATRLVQAVSAGLRSIRQRPFAWPMWSGGLVRRRVLRRVPYSLFSQRWPARL